MRILITGATGLVGQGVLEACLGDAGVDKIVALGRHASGRTHDKLSDLVCADFADLGIIEDQLHPFDACLYCAGAPPVGTPKEQYRHVTLDLTLNVARTLAQHNPDLTFVYISGAYSNPDSHIMPLRIKGETERALGELPITTVMLRPGGIQPVGDEHSPHKGMDMLYGVTGPLMGLGVRLMPGMMTTTRRVGRAMLEILRQDTPPAVVENADINRLGQ